MSVTKRPDGSWRARWREFPGGPQQARHFNKKVDAERFLLDIEHSKQTGATSTRSPAESRSATGRSSRAVGQLHHAPSTTAHIETTFRNHVYPVIGERPLATCAPTNYRPSSPPRRKAGPGHGAHHRRTPLVRVPGRGARRQARGHRGRRQTAPVGSAESQGFDAAQGAGLESAMPAHLAALVPLAVGTGVRLGEATGLSVDRVDFLRRMVHVDRQLITPSGPGAPYLADLKTKASHRRIPAPAIVLEALAAHLSTPEPGEDGLLFTDGKDRPIRRSRLARPGRERCALPTCLGAPVSRPAARLRVGAIRGGLPCRRWPLDSATRHRPSRLRCTPTSGRTTRTAPGTSSTACSVRASSEAFREQFSLDSC